MSAPKRTPSPTEARSIPQELSRWIEDRERWVARFLANLKRDNTAELAWEMLRKAQLEAVAHNCLFSYAYPRTMLIDEEQRKLQDVIRKVKALERAVRVEHEKKQGDDPRTGLFCNRSDVKEHVLLNAEVPYAFDGTTVANWISERLPTGKSMCDLRGLRKAFASLGLRSPISDRKFWLHVLRCYAVNAEVKLGAERLAALANCSDPNSHLDPRTLARNLKLFSPSVVSADCNDIRRVSPPFPLLPPKA
jgi:hypothetical protein